jgi:hypothetical protein
VRRRSGRRRRGEGPRGGHLGNFTQNVLNHATPIWVRPQPLPCPPLAPIALLITLATLSAAVGQREMPWARGGDLPDSATPAVTTTLPAASSAVVEPSYESYMALRCCRRGSGAPGRRPGAVCHPLPNQQTLPQNSDLGPLPECTPSQHESYIICNRSGALEWPSGTFWTGPHGQTMRHAVQARTRAQR